MKLLYATSIIFPSFRANRIQTISMAEEFQKFIGNDFYLGGHDINVKNNIVNIINFKSTTKSYFLSLRYLFFIKRNNITHVYCREEKLLFFMILYNKLFFHLPLKFVYEAHFVLQKTVFWYNKVLKWTDKIVVLARFIKKEFEGFGINENKILVEPNGVDLEKFGISLSKSECRKKLNLPQDKKIILYTGHLYYWKGTQTLVDASRYLDDELIIFVGGTKKDIQESIRRGGKNQKSRNIRFLGQKPHSEIPLYLKAADVLVLPNSSKNDISKYYTSPMKLFEYMASGSPMVASNLPSIREILNDPSTSSGQANSILDSRAQLPPKKTIPYNYNFYSNPCLTNRLKL